MDGQVAGLGAWCELVPAGTSTASPGSVSFDVDEFAVLADGRRVVISAGERGFSVSGPPDLLAHLTADSIRADVLTTVLPDDDDGEQHPWEWLAGRLRAQGVPVSGQDLRTLPYVVELGPEVQRLLGRRG